MQSSKQSSKDSNSLTLFGFSVPAVAIERLKTVARFSMVTSIVLVGIYSLRSVQHQPIPNYLTVLTLLGSIALLAHALEAIVAVVIDRSERSAWQVLIYTLGVGTISLIEIWEQRR